MVWYLNRRKKCCPNDQQLPTSVIFFVSGRDSGLKTENNETGIFFPAPKQWTRKNRESIFEEVASIIKKFRPRRCWFPNSGKKMFRIVYQGFEQGQCRQVGSAALAGWLSG